jgi:NAD(P)-dependent dehydrogenase (short-subunit alcohol dehydrogenase family)
VSAESTKAVIISVSSEIGQAIAREWIARGIEVVGTFRTDSDQIQELKRSGARLVQCDLSSPHSMRRAEEQLEELSRGWTILILATGSLEPISLFEQAAFESWESSFVLNFSSQVRIIHQFLPSRSKSTTPIVITFAGGGINSAPTETSAYTLSKYALVKLMELLAAEMSDVAFVSVGPGWVRTRIHDVALAPAVEHSATASRTRERLRGGPFVQMQRVVDCCSWLVSAPPDAITGRNFSVADDAWGDESLVMRLRSNPEQFKLRRVHDTGG